MIDNGRMQHIALVAQGIADLASTSYADYAKSNKDFFGEAPAEDGYIALTSERIADKIKIIKTLNDMSDADYAATAWETE